MNKELAILLRAKGAAQAAADVKKVDSSIGNLTRRAGTFATNLKGNVGSALTTFGGRLKGAAMGLAAFAGVGGLLGVGEALKTGISKAQSWGAAIEKLGPITGATAEQLSGLLAIGEKYGLDVERLTKLAGFEAKAVEAVSLSAKGATKFQKAYGFSILDSRGKVKDFNTMLLTFSDYYKANTNAGQKNAAAAKLFGRSYTDLVPILALGSKGIRDAEEEAKALGLTLTKDNVGALAKAREATRKWGDALGGLELQIGLAVLPAVTDLAKAATGFVSGHRNDIVSFFKGAVEFGRSAISTISSVAGALNDAWNKVPAPIRDLLVKSLVGDRIVKFLFGFSPIKVAVGLATGLLEGVSKSVAGGLIGAGIGKAFVQPVFVTNMGAGGMGGGGVVGAKGGSGIAGKIGGVLAVIGVAQLADMLAPVVTNIGSKIHDALVPKNSPLNDFGKAWSNWRATADWPFGQKNAPDWAKVGNKDAASPASSKPGQVGGLSPTERAELKAQTKAVQRTAGILQNADRWWQTTASKTEQTALADARTADRTEALRRTLAAKNFSPKITIPVHTTVYAQVSARETSKTRTTYKVYNSGSLGKYAL